MSNNEDYLDSLLRSVQQDVAPDSALEKLKTEEIKTEAVAEESATAVSDVEQLLNDLDSDNLLVEPDDIELPPLEDMSNEVEEVLSQIDNADSIAVDENISNEDLSALLETLEVEVAAEEPEIVPSEDLAVLEEVAEEEPAPAVNSDPNAMMSADDIAALLASMENAAPEEAATETAADVPTEEVVIEEPAEEIIVETVVEEEPAEETIAEAVVEEAPAPAVSSDPNAMMSADDIAALLASMENSTPEEAAIETAADVPTEEAVILEEAGEEAPDEEVVVIEEPAEETIAEAVVEETPAPAVSSDPNAMMSADDIAALLASMENAAPEEAATETTADVPTEEAVILEEVGEEAPAEEVVVIEEPAEEIIVETVAEEIPAEEAIAEPVQDAVSETTEDTSTITDIDDIDKLLAQAEPETTEEPAPADDAVVTDIDALLAEAEKFAASDEEIPQSEDDGDITKMSQDQIENMINQAGNVETSEEEIDLSDISGIDSDIGLSLSENDAQSIEDEMSGFDSLIDELSASDPNLSDEEAMMNLFSEAYEKQEAVEKQEAEEKAALKEKKKKEKAAKKDKKKKKAKKGEREEINFEAIEGGDGEVSISAEELDKLFDSEKAPKKKGPFGKLLDFLTETDEGEEAEGSVPAADGEGATGENQAILKELDAEGEEASGKKKKKKDKKGKKGKAEATEGEDGEDGEETAKPKKAKKPKKEKGPKKPFFDPEESAKKLSKKNVRRIAILCLSILVAILLLVFLVPPIITANNAREAYFKGNYEATYLDFYGEDLSESDQIIFERSKIVLRVRTKIESHDNFVKMGKNAEALDQLLMAVQNYESWLATAETVGATKEFKAEYSKLLDLLANNYSLDEKSAWEIINIEDDQIYSMKVYAIANHTEYIDPYNMPEPFVAPEEKESSTEETDNKTDFEDLLPEEIDD